MKQDDNVAEGSKHYKESLVSFSTSRSESFFVSRMSFEESFMRKLQRQSRKQLQKLKEEQERLREQQKIVNILLLQFRPLKRIPPFSSPIYFSSF
jgi:hypothetical protein